MLVQMELVVTASCLRFLILLLVAVATPASAEVINNREFRFVLTKPDGWHDVPFRIHREGIRDEIWLDENKRKKTIGTIRPPVVMFGKYKEPLRDQNAGLIIDHSRNDKLLGIPTTRILDAVTGIDQSIYRMFSASPARAVTLGGLPAAYTKHDLETKYTHGTYRIIKEIWIVPRDGAFLTVMIQAKRSDAASLAMLKSVVESIRFQK